MFMFKGCKALIFSSCPNGELPTSCDQSVAPGANGLCLIKQAYSSYM